MESYEKKRAELTSKLLEILKEVAEAENIDVPFCIYLPLTKKQSKKYREEYDEDLKIFKTLFRFNDKDVRIALWNSIEGLSANNMPPKKDFSAEEYAFLKAYAVASETLLFEANVNKPIDTNRLTLRAATKCDCKLLAYRYKNDGDFTFYTSKPATAKYIKAYAQIRCPNYYVIEKKASQNMIGYIGLSVKDESATGLLEYYIFKEYRNMGYCKEAITALVDKALSGKLYKPVEVAQRFVYGRKRITLNAVRARISTVNVPSINTVTSCGFVHEATIHKTMNKPGIGWTNEEIYYITKEKCNAKQ